MTEDAKRPQLQPELKLDDDLRHLLQHEDSTDSAIDVADGASLTSESSLADGAPQIVLGDNWSVVSHTSNPVVQHTKLVCTGRFC